MRGVLWNLNISQDRDVGPCVVPHPHTLTQPGCFLPSLNTASEFVVKTPFTTDVADVYSPGSKAFSSSVSVSHSLF